MNPNAAEQNGKTYSLQPAKLHSRDEGEEVEF
jgi:hypothetical protein